ncbi:MAG: VIT domain-containing protein [Planctomycetota bacterium]
MAKPLCSLFPFLFAVPIAAQGLLIEPGPGPGPGPGSIVRPDPGRPVAGPVVKLRKTSIRADIVDGVATTMVEQTFFNEGGRDAEGTWFLPLPMGAVADGFTMTVGGKELAGEVLDAGQARGVYEAIVRKRRDPGLLEFAGEGLLRARIFPIPAQGEVTVNVRLRQVLQPTGNVFEWQWPLRATGYGDTGQGLLAMDVRISSQTRISTVVTPHASAEITRDGDRKARVSFEGMGEKVDDLRVLYGLSEQEFGLHLLTYNQIGDPGYFVMLLSPPRELGGKAPRRCVQFVVDTSGSMAGPKIAQAKAALGMFLKSLRPRDLFQVVGFASSVQRFFDEPRQATAENVAAALERVNQLEAKGGTNIGDALQQAFEVQMPPDGDDGAWLGQIVFVTDGEPTVGLTNPQQILDLAQRADKQQIRLFALGVGDDIDVRLIDDLAQQHRGARDFVRNQEKIEVKVDALCQKIAQPALTDVEVSCGSLDAYDVHPARTRDLFCGEMLQVVGRYRNSGMQTVRVRGKQNGAPKEYVFEVEFPKLAEQHQFVQTVWARQHVASLLDAIRRNGAKQELVTEVKKLATRYGIVTPYTSQLIVEEGMRLARDDRDGIRRQPSPAADGVPLPGGGRGAQTGARGVDTGAAAGPTTGGPAGPGAQAPTGPTTPGAAADPPATSLAALGRTRTGADAVRESLETTGSDDFYLGKNGRKAAEAKKTADGKPMLRRALGRVFVQVGDDLVEQGLPEDWSKQAVVIEAFSDDYFALLRANPKLKDILALDERVVFRDGERIVRIAPAKPKAEPVKETEKVKDAR